MFDPPRKPIPSPPGDGPPLPLVVIDTEEESWSYLVGQLGGVR